MLVFYHRCCNIERHPFSGPHGPVFVVMRKKPVDTDITGTARKRLWTEIKYCSKNSTSTVTSQAAHFTQVFGRADASGGSDLPYCPSHPDPLLSLLTASGALTAKRCRSPPVSVPQTSRQTVQRPPTAAAAAPTALQGSPLSHVFHGAPHRSRKAPPPQPRSPQPKALVEEPSLGVNFPAAAMPIIPPNREPRDQSSLGGPCAMRV